ncbi:MAG: sulfurtransferase [Pseudomonadota bacterium]
MNFDTLISAQDLTVHLNDLNWVVFDCRFSLADTGSGGRLYREGHIPGARYAHLDRDLSSAVTDSTGRHPLPDPEVLARKLGGWGVNRDTQVVVYDDAGGAFAGRMWWLLRWLGHDKAAVLDGGIKQWLKAGGVLSADIPQPVATTFIADIDRALWLDATQVRQGQSDGRILLIDARAAGRFRGEHEPIDSVAGHVPGAVNRPLQLNLADDGCFLPVEELHRQFLQRLGAFEPEKVVHMCGSGVTACHNVLAMEAAGLAGSKLYAGSWSEWIRDPARPVATGPE